ncbi:hypothetical protein Cni_G21645 [Canna indica]|uniref:Translation initiation factor 3 N-terminal domain-containing protein n=1 Tax=Canna indica TaxID=4628 RepID=A0AAQ3KSJ3_9LILI|nr:hypothetical protein Cni_G21645 [Canna indica]
MFCSLALRRISAPGKRGVGNEIYIHRYGGLSEHTGLGFSGGRLVLDQIGFDRDPSCLQPCRRWYSHLSSVYGAQQLDWQNHRLRYLTMKNLLGSCTAVCPSLSFKHTPVRNFAAPVQSKQKLKSDTDEGPRLNDAITAPVVRLVTDEGHGIVSRREALDRAKKLNLDLVEVQRTANPPVCKIMDYHKEKFKQEVKEKERVKSKSQLALRSGENKEVRFKAKTEVKDLKIKAETVIRLMERGYRVKCTALPTKEGEDLGQLLTRLLPLIEDVSILESGPHVDTKQAYIIVRHVKFLSKKSGKKISNVVDAVAKGSLGTVSSTAAKDSNTSQDGRALLSEEEWEPVDCSSEAEDEAQAQENPQHLSCKATTSHNATSRPHLLHKNHGGGLGHKLPVSPAVSRFTAPKPGLGASRSGSEVSTEPSVVAETNRYSKRTETHQSNSAGRNNAAPYFKATGNRGWTPPNSAHSGAEKTHQSGDQGRYRGPMTSKTDGAESPGKSYGMFSSKRAATGNGSFSTPEPRNSGANTETIAKHRTTSPTPSFGNFGTKKPAASSSDENSGDSPTSKPSSSLPPTRKYGIFSSTKSASSGN